jgi:hypothetical protein
MAENAALKKLEKNSVVVSEEFAKEKNVAWKEANN